MGKAHGQRIGGYTREFRENRRIRSPVEAPYSGEQSRLSA